MVVNANNFIFVGCANHAENDSDPQGGAIDKSKLIVMYGLEMTGSDLLQMECNVAITAVYTITGRFGGALVSDTFTFSNETGPVNGASGTVFDRILKVVKTAQSPTQVASNAVIGFHEKTTGLNKGYLYGSGRSISGVEIEEVRRLFFAATRPGVTSPPAAKDLFEKFFILQASPTDTLSSGEVRKTADPGAMCTFAISDALDDSESTANRITAPTSVSAFDSQDKTIPDGSSPAGGSVGPGEAIGVWVRLRLYSYHLVGTGSVNFQIRGEGL